MRLRNKTSSLSRRPDLRVSSLGSCVFDIDFGTRLTLGSLPTLFFSSDGFSVGTPMVVDSLLISFLSHVDRDFLSFVTGLFIVLGLIHS